MSATIARLIMRNIKTLRAINKRFVEDQMTRSVPFASFLLTIAVVLNILKIQLTRSMGNCRSSLQKYLNLLLKGISISEKC